MVPTRWRRATFFCVMTVAFAGWRATPALAAPLPLRAEVCVGRQIDIAAFERLVAARYHIHFRKVVAADIDRDGDLDVIAATDRTFMVWVNDGRGHLTSQPPTHAPAVEGRTTGTAWRDRQARADEPIQNDLPSVPLPGMYPHAPPAVVAANRSLPDSALRPETAFGCRTPRAPPA